MFCGGTQAQRGTRRAKARAERAFACGVGDIHSSRVARVRRSVVLFLYCGRAGGAGLHGHIRERRQRGVSPTKVGFGNTP